MQLRWLSRPAPYPSVWQAMQTFTHERNADTEDELWLVEHAPVYTLGQAGLEKHILNPHGIPVVHCNRGGQVTYHGPGQVILYTLVNLQRHRITAHGFVNLLEQAVLDLLSRYGVRQACRKQGAPGVYVPQSALTHPQGTDLAKIAALGLKIHRGCAYHGIALNVAMDLRPFLGINPCGQAGLQTVDMQACGLQVSVTEAGNALARAFQTLWDSDFNRQDAPHRLSA